MLDPDSTYAKDFYDDVVELVASVLAISPQNLSDTETPWLASAFNWLVQALLNPSDPSIRPEVREAFLKDFEQLCRDQNIEFDRNNKRAAAVALFQQFKLAVDLPKALGASLILAKGMWFRSTTQITQNAWLQKNDITQTGGKLATLLKVRREVQPKPCR